MMLNISRTHKRSIRLGDVAPPPVVRPGAPFRTFMVPDDGHTYMQFVPDWFIADPWKYQPRCFNISGWNQTTNSDGAFPATVRCYAEDGTDNPVPLSEPWQRRWYQALNRASGEQMPGSVLGERWGHITEDGRALTDNTAAQNGYIDYVLGLNLGNPNGPIRQKKLGMVGNIVRVKRIENGWVYVEALNVGSKQNPTTPPALDDIFYKPWLTMWATQTIRDYKVIDWHWLDYPPEAKVAYGVPFFFVSENGTNRVHDYWLRPIQNGSVYSPYA
jgi:hypothetical protein